MVQSQHDCYLSAKQRYIELKASMLRGGRYTYTKESLTTEYNKKKVEEMKEQYGFLKPYIGDYLEKPMEEYLEFYGELRRGYYRDLMKTDPGEISLNKAEPKSSLNKWVKCIQSGGVLVLNQVVKIQHTTVNGEVKTYMRNDPEFDKLIASMKRTMVPFKTQVHMRTLPCEKYHEEYNRVGNDVYRWKYIYNELVWYQEVMKKKNGTWDFTLSVDGQESIRRYNDGLIDRVIYIEGYGENVTLKFRGGDEEVELFFYKTALKHSKFDDRKFRWKIARLEREIFFNYIIELTSFLYRDGYKYGLYDEKEDRDYLEKMLYLSKYLGISKLTSTIQRYINDTYKAELEKNKKVIGLIGRLHSMMDRLKGKDDERVKATLVKMYSGTKDRILSYFQTLRTQHSFYTGTFTLFKYLVFHHAYQHVIVPYCEAILNSGVPEFKREQKTGSKQKSVSKKKQKKKQRTSVVRNKTFPHSESGIRVLTWNMDAIYESEQSQDTKINIIKTAIPGSGPSVVLLQEVSSSMVERLKGLFNGRFIYRPSVMDNRWGVAIGWSNHFKKEDLETNEFCSIRCIGVRLRRESYPAITFISIHNRFKSQLNTSHSIISSSTPTIMAGDFNCNIHSPHNFCKKDMEALKETFDPYPVLESFDEAYNFTQNDSIDKPEIIDFMMVKRDHFKVEPVSFSHDSLLSDHSLLQFNVNQTRKSVGKRFMNNLSSWVRGK